jgi:hypothetical protein
MELQIDAAHRVKSRPLAAEERLPAAIPLFHPPRGQDGRAHRFPVSG